MKPGSLWVHQKTGNRYMIVALARMESTLEPVVETLSNLGPDGEVHARFSPRGDAIRRLVGAVNDAVRS